MSRGGNGDRLTVAHLFCRVRIILTWATCNVGSKSDFILTVKVVFTESVVV